MDTPCRPRPPKLQSPIEVLDSSPSGCPLASLMAQIVKKLPAMPRSGFDPWVGKIPWRKEWQPTPIFLSEELHGQRILAGYSPRGHKDSDMTKQLTLYSPQSIRFNLIRLHGEELSNTAGQEMCPKAGGGSF